MTDRETFEQWAAKQWGSDAWRHTSATSGEWEAFQAGCDMGRQAEPLGDPEWEPVGRSGVLWKFRRRDNEQQAEPSGDVEQMLGVLADRREQITRLEAENDRLRAKQQAEPVAWLVRRLGKDIYEQAEPDEKAPNPVFWSDAFPVYAAQNTGLEIGRAHV